jgi:trans-aconitate 2-methyltransferase
MDWNPAQYLRFADERERPARDLLAAVPGEPARIVDIGCGPGNSTALLLARYPGADVIGLDPDAGMIAAARAALPGCRFIRGRVEDWTPDAAPDLVFANASLQWAGEHAALFPRLVGTLAEGGSLAVQMPDNLDEPTHVAMGAVARQPRWSARLAAAADRRAPLLAPAALHAVLRPLCRRVEVWRTIYHVELQGLDGIVAWFKGSALGPYLALLDADAAADFLAAFREAIAPAYPVDAAGRVLLPFPRLFFVATR